MLVLDSLKIVTINVLFRFFFIVHADKGFVVGIKFRATYIYEIFQVAGKLNTRLTNGIYAILRCEKQTIKLRNFKIAILIEARETNIQIKKL